MKLDNDFEPSANTYDLPDKLLDKLEACWKGLKHVVVERRAKRGLWPKVNGFDVSVDVKGQPDDNPEEVATMIVAIAATDVEIEGEEGTYRARFIRNNEGKDSRRQTYSFKQKFDGTADSSSDDEPSMMQLLSVMHNQQNHLVQVLIGHNEALVGRMIEHDQVSTKQIELLTKTNEVMAQQYHQGLSMQSSAMTQILDIERSLEADRQRGQNSAALLKTVDKVLPKALLQWGMWLRKKAKDEKKANGDTSADEDEDEDDEKDEDEDSDENDEKKPEETEEQRELRKNLKTRPLTTFAHAFKDSISTDQWLDITQVLTKAQGRALKEATTADNDEATAAGILRLRDLLLKKPDKFEELAEILSEKQTEMILKLNEKAEAYEEKLKEEEPEKKDN